MPRSLSPVSSIRELGCQLMMNVPGVISIQKPSDSTPLHSIPNSDYFFLFRWEVCLAFSYRNGRKEGSEEDEQSFAMPFVLMSRVERCRNFNDLLPPFPIHRNGVSALLIALMMEAGMPMMMGTGANCCDS